MDREALFLENQRLAYYVMQKQFRTLANDEDIVQEAMAGLWKACRKFDDSKAMFSTFAVACIRNEVLMALRSRGKSVRTMSLEMPMGEGLTLQDMLEDTRPHSLTVWWSSRRFLPEEEMSKSRS